ncbi:hypothetical protein WJX72_001883 [[Myrmecia] bisecta]|uniref:AAA+ ATPase domain-containing protein n=1 Tax=[Myrmecia] bisecta TaxID=41462 RepID=A0AAW1Q6M6_9CHLO
MFGVQGGAAHLRTADVASCSHIGCPPAVACSSASHAPQRRRLRLWLSSPCLRTLGCQHLLPLCSNRRQPWRLRRSLRVSASSKQEGGAAKQQAQQQQQQAQQQQAQSRTQQQQAPAQQPLQASQQAPAAGKQFLFEPTFGLPVARRYLGYGDLLREIRLGNVKQLLFFAQGEELELEGPCLVVDHNNVVAQSYVPHFDYRIPYAMETHGVKASRLSAAPSQAELTPSVGVSARTTKLVTTALPLLAILVVYIATQVAHALKGDIDDRRKIRRVESEKEAEAALQREADALAMEARELAALGLDVDEICRQLDRLQLPYERSYVEDLVAKEEQKAAAAPEVMGPVYTYNTEAEKQAEAMREEKRKKQAEEEGADEMEKMAQFGKMTSVKITMRRDEREEEMKVKVRAAQRRMKGVKLQYTDEDRVFFDDVQGIGDAKIELMEVVDFFRVPDLFKRSGARIPKGVLLCGPPGTGKTLLARAVAGEAGVAFLSLNASEFVEMFVGVGASRVRDLFAQARKLAPAIIFIDEIDAVGRIRGGAQGNDERDQTLNQMLSEMDGFDQDVGVIVMGATNRKDVLDPALIRPGRFDRIVQVGLPDFYGRIDILKVHLAKRAASVGEDVEPNLHELSYATQQFSGAALANLVNMAAMIVGREGRQKITYDDLVQALDYERLGPKRRPYSDKRRKRLAVQEGATALVCALLPAIEPIDHVTIVPREKFPLGQTVLKVNEARQQTHLFTRRYLEEQLLTVLAGRAAEELVYGKDGMSTINQRRLVMARRIVQKLVVSSAMSDNLDIGPRTVSTPRGGGGSSLKQIVLSRVTSETHLSVDQEMEAQLNAAYSSVLAMLSRNQAALDAIMDALLNSDKVDGATIKEIVGRLADPADLERRKLEQEVFM